MLDETLRVAIIEPTGGHSGMHRSYDFGLCAGLLSVSSEGSGYAAIIPTLYTCDVTPAPPNGIAMRTPFKRIYGSDPAWRRGLRYLRGSLSAHWHAKSTGTKLVHYHIFHVGPLELFNFFLSRLLRLKVVITAHDVVAFTSRNGTGGLQAWLYRVADGVIVHNEFSSQTMTTTRQLAIIPHGLDIFALNKTLPDKRMARTALKLAPDSHTLLFFGQIKQVKGLDVLIKSLPTVAGAMPDVQLVVAGRPWKDDATRYQALSEALGVAEYCHWHLRFIPNGEVELFFGSADLVILPYQRIYQSGILLMAMGYGVPVLASDLPAISEQVTDGENGFLFHADDSADLAQKIITLLKNPADAQAVGTAARSWVEQQYGWESIGQQTAQFYRQVLAQ